jgi:hypothetical protein
MDEPNSGLNSGMCRSVNQVIRKSMSLERAWLECEQGTLDDAAKGTAAVRALACDDHQAGSLLRCLLLCTIAVLSAVSCLVVQ